MDTWYDYRLVWSTHPWLAVYFVIVVLVLLLAIVGTITGVGIYAVLFVPSLAGAYVHHLMVMKRLDR